MYAVLSNVLLVLDRKIDGFICFVTDIQTNRRLSLTTGTKTENRHSDVNTHPLFSGKRQSHEKQVPVLKYA